MTLAINSSENASTIRFHDTLTSARRDSTHCPRKASLVPVPSELYTVSAHHAHCLVLTARAQRSLGRFCRTCALLAVIPDERPELTLDRLKRASSLHPFVFSVITDRC